MPAQPEVGPTTKGFLHVISKRATSSPPGRTTKQASGILHAYCTEETPAMLKCLVLKWARTILRNQMQAAAFPVRFVPGVRLLAFDFAVA
eukprot:2857991-Rhodomonas_salina.4